MFQTLHARKSFVYQCTFSTPLSTDAHHSRASRSRLRRPTRTHAARFVLLPASKKTTQKQIREYYTIVDLTVFVAHRWRVRDGSHASQRESHVRIVFTSLIFIWRLARHALVTQFACAWSDALRVGTDSMVTQKCNRQTVIDCHLAAIALITVHFVNTRRGKANAWTLANCNSPKYARACMYELRQQQTITITMCRSER